MKPTIVNVRNAERGDADTFEFTVGIVPLVMIMLLITAVAIIRPAQLPVWIAARECARMMTTTLDRNVALSQGLKAGQLSIQGNPIAGVSVGDVSFQQSYPMGDARGGTAECRVSYTIPLANLPMVGGLFGDVPVDAKVAMTIDPLKSEWLDSDGRVSSP